MKQTLSAPTDRCRPRDRKTSPEHDSPTTGQAVCRRCGTRDEGTP